jgi:hypothetical protein
MFRAMGVPSYAEPTSSAAALIGEHFALHSCKMLTNEARPVQRLVYAQHGHELMGWKSPVREPHSHE